MIGKSEDVVVDSAAEIDVCPPGFGGAWRATGLPVRPIRIVSAGGHALRHFGRKLVIMQIDDQVVTVNFAVVDVKRPILSVARLRDGGTR